MNPQKSDTAAPAGKLVMRKANPLQAKCLRPGDADDEAVAAIARAEQALDHLSVNFDEWMEIECGQLTAARDKARASRFADDDLTELFQTSHNLKGQATTLGYPFADEICASLCRLIDNTADKTRLPAQLIDQHVDAVRALVREGAKGSENPKASVLAKRLRDVTNDFLSRQNARSRAA